MKEKKESFFKKWKRGMTLITPQQILQSRIVAHKGIIIVMGGASIVSISRVSCSDGIGKSDIMSIAIAALFGFFMFLQFLEIKTHRRTIEELDRKEKEFESEEREKNGLGRPI